LTFRGAWQAVPRIAFGLRDRYRILLERMAAAAAPKFERT
jgi:hypothetical protein